jgi:hypothetical protein
VVQSVFLFVVPIVVVLSDRLLIFPDFIAGFPRPLPHRHCPRSAAQHPRVAARNTTHLCSLIFTVI